MKTPVASTSGLVALKVGKEKVWVGFVLAPKGLKRVVADKSRSKVARLIAPLAPFGLVRAESAAIARRFQAYGRGKRDAFAGLALDLSGATPFQVAVLKALQNIDFGKVKTYGDVARLIGRPRAARAVGAAVAWNPLPIVIPCHRVVGQGGKLGGYSMAGGPTFKRVILAHEGLSGPWK